MKNSNKSGLLYKTTTYLSFSMENSTNQDFRNQCLKFYKQIGVKVLDPYNKPFISNIEESPAFKEELLLKRKQGKLAWVHKKMRDIRAVDLSCCDRADFITCHVYPKVASWGTAEEIYTANRAKKPIFITVDGGVKNAPLWLLGVLPPKYFYNSVDEMLKMIYSIHNGQQKIDSSRWKLLKPHYRN